MFLNTVRFAQWTYRAELLAIKSGHPLTFGILVFWISHSKYKVNPDEVTKAAFYPITWRISNSSRHFKFNFAISSTRWDSSQIVMHQERSNVLEKEMEDFSKRYFGSATVFHSTFSCSPIHADVFQCAPISFDIKIKRDLSLLCQKKLNTFSTWAFTIYRISPFNQIILHKTNNFFVKHFLYMSYRLTTYLFSDFTHAFETCEYIIILKFEDIQSTINDQLEN